MAGHHWNDKLGSEIDNMPQQNLENDFGGCLYPMVNIEDPCSLDVKMVSMLEDARLRRNPIS